MYYIYIGKILLATTKGDAYCPAWLLTMRSIYEETAGGNLVRKIQWKADLWFTMMCSKTKAEPLDLRSCWQVTHVQNCLDWWKQPCPPVVDDMATLRERERGLETIERNKPLIASAVGVCQKNPDSNRRDRERSTIFMNRGSWIQGPVLHLKKQQNDDHWFAGMIRTSRIFFGRSCPGNQGNPRVYHWLLLMMRFMVYVMVIYVIKLLIRFHWLVRLSASNKSERRRQIVLWLATKEPRFGCFVRFCLRLFQAAFVFSHEGRLYILAGAGQGAVVESCWIHIDFTEMGWIIAMVVQLSGGDTPSLGMTGVFTGSHLDFIIVWFKSRKIRPEHICCIPGSSG